MSLYAINHYGVANIASLAPELDIHLVHISTDYVFDGASKLSGEEEIRKICTKYYIIRTAWLYGQFGPNFVYIMLKLMNKQRGRPTLSFQRKR